MDRASLRIKTEVVSTGCWLKEKVSTMETNDKEILETPAESAVEPGEGVTSGETLQETAQAAKAQEEVIVDRFTKVDEFIKGMIRTDHPEFRPGDTVKVHVKIIEGNKERIQVFEGVVIALRHGGIDETFTVRKNSWGVGVERTFFMSSPRLDKIEVTRRGRVRRAKLYYLRQRAGKSARIAERRQTRPQEKTKS